MKSLHKSVLIWFSPQQMFNVVTDVAHYQTFLPWCADSCVLERYERGMKARIVMQLAGFKQLFTTHNTHSKKEGGGLAVAMELIDGPFSKLEGTWSFDPIAGSEDVGTPACKVKLDLDYEMKNSLLDLTIGSAFDKIANSLVDAFVERAKKIYK